MTNYSGENVIPILFSLFKEYGRSQVKRKGVILTFRKNDPSLETRNVFKLNNIIRESITNPSY